MLDVTKCCCLWHGLLCKQHFINTAWNPNKPHSSCSVCFAKARVSFQPNPFPPAVCLRLLSDSSPEQHLLFAIHRLIFIHKHQVIRGTLTHQWSRIKVDLCWVWVSKVNASGARLHADARHVQPWGRSPEAAGISAGDGAGKSLNQSPAAVHIMSLISHLLWYLLMPRTQHPHPPNP